MTWDQWFGLFTHFLLLSLLAIGGAIPTAPDMHRYVVERNGWLTDEKFNASIAIAQAAPGPNVLFIPLIGWQTGLALGGTTWAALAGLCATFIGIMLPSSLLTFVATRWLHKNPEHIVARASKASLAPISIALILATAWLLTAAHNQPGKDWPLWLLTALCLLLAWRTKLHLLWLLGAGALLGALGVV
ncbi:MAG: chromate transporter [Burkholderiaceae bacterium]